MSLPAPPFDRVGIAGGGLMGTGIAAQLAVSGQRVVVCEADAAAAARVVSRCDAVFAELVSGGAIGETDARQAAARIDVATDLDALAGVPFVLEAVTESLGVKHTLYAALERVLAPHAILASSTSGFLPADLCEPLVHPERFLVAHFWNPPHLVRLVEVVAGPSTTPDVTARTMDALTAFGCTPVRLDKAVPGFIGNRLQFAVLREALHLLAEGVADAETIDFVMTQSIGRRYAWIGPLAGADIGGLATFRAIATYLMPTLGRDESALALLDDLVSRGRLGRASGGGFHDWSAEREAALREARLALLHRGTPDRHA